MSEDKAPEGGLPDEQDHVDAQLYLAQFDQVAGRVLLRDRGEQPISISGEILVAGRLSDEQTLIVEEIRRVSLWSADLPELRGLFSLAGLVKETSGSVGSAGDLEPFAMRLYYPLLSELKPACEESDAQYPVLETLQGRLNWEPEGSIAANMPRMRITVLLDKLIDYQIGAIQVVAFGPSVLSFQLLEDGGFAAPRANSLASCSNSPQATAPGNSHERRRLQLRFISLSQAVPNPLQLEGVAKQLIDAACEVWWGKGGVRIDPDPTITAPANTLNGSVGSGQYNMLPGINLFDAFVEVFLADKLPDDPGGGTTRNCGTSAAYVILKIEEAQNNKYLLAHELGHVLGLTHPGDPATTVGDCKSYVEGSGCSVMVPDHPNSSRNTQNNIGVIENAANPLPTGPILASLSQLGGWKPDLEQGFFHIIRDFPHDDGTVASVPATPFGDWWSYSDVWNSSKQPLTEQEYDDGSPMFLANSTPTHSEPTTTGVNNMCVRLHTCQKLNAQVQVRFYLAVPGAAGEPLRPLQNGSVVLPPLNFSGTSLPQPGRPQTKSVGWTVPVGLPSHSCVFAVAQSANEATPIQLQNIINDPTNPLFNFFSLFNFVASNNDVAQRNLHIQSTTPAPHMLSWSMLAWVQIGNPFDEAGPAHLEIDTTSAAKLEGLLLELDDEIVGRMEIGGTTSFVLDQALRPGDDRVLRFRALLPSDMPEGATFPIGLRFFVGDQLISGYQHVLRVAPLSETVSQVLDTLFGALRDVAVGFESQDALKLADSVASIRARYAEAPEQALDSLRRLSHRMAAVAQTVDPGSAPEGYAVQRRLYELAGLLLTRPNTAPPNQLVEQVRDVADHMQELAAREVRRSPEKQRILNVARRRRGRSPNKRKGYSS